MRGVAAGRDVSGLCVSGTLFGCDIFSVAPQWGQDVALSDTLPPQYLQYISAIMLVFQCFISFQYRLFSLRHVLWNDGQ